MQLKVWPELSQLTASWPQKNCKKLFHYIFCSLPKITLTFFEFIDPDLQNAFSEIKVNKNSKNSICQKLGASFCQCQTSWVDLGRQPSFEKWNLCCSWVSALRGLSCVGEVTLFCELLRKWQLLFCVLARITCNSCQQSSNFKRISKNRRRRSANLEQCQSVRLQPFFMEKGF